MIRTIRLFAAAAALILPFLPAMAGKYIDVSHDINGHNRTGVLYLPDNIKENAPLVVVVHGYGGKANPKDFDIDPVADKNGFAVLYPQGLKDPSGKTGFYVGYPSQKGMNIDDVDEICKFTSFIQKEYELSKRNTFMTGMSNGGDLCYLAALSGQKTFAALASVAGLTFTWMTEIDKTPVAVPFLEIHGTEDRVSEWGGDLKNAGGWGAYISVPLAVNYWVAMNRCKEVVSDTIPSKDPASKHYVVRHFFKGGKNGNEVWLYKVVGAPHCWHNGDINTGEEIWKFFSKYIKP